MTTEQFKPSIVLVAGPTASGKSKEAIRIALERDGEIISVDSRQVYRGLDIGTEKISVEEMQGVPHYLLDIRDPKEPYNAGDFCMDAHRLIREISMRGKLPILAGGSHFYFDALLYGLPKGEPDPDLRAQLETLPTEDLLNEIHEKDPKRFAELDPHNRRRLIRAIELIRTHGFVPKRDKTELLPYAPEWVIINPDREILRPRIEARLQEAIDRGLIDEVRRVRADVGDDRLNELGLEYRIVGEYLRDERDEESLLPALSTRLWHYARRQKAWLRKLATESSATIDS
jgi:tRNA dimethylallyltransferase